MRLNLGREAAVLDAVAARLYGRTPSWLYEDHKDMLTALMYIEVRTTMMIEVKHKVDPW